MVLLIIINHIVSKHLYTMSSYVAKIKFNKSDNILTLKRNRKSSSKADELDRLASAINEMRLRIATDIEYRNQKENELRATKESAESANKEKSLFLAKMSHELRTPLNAIIGFSELLLTTKKESSEETLTEYLTHISNAGNHLLSIITDLLDASAIEMGKFELRKSEFDLAQMLDSCIISVSTLSSQKSIKTHQDYSKLGIACADKNKIVQVVSNLLVNAIKFTADGGEIGITASRNNSEFTICVWDTGIGIDDTVKSRIFDTFFQAETGLYHKYGGVGLGLSIVKKIVEEHGGKIWAESEKGVGSHFFFTLPK